MTQSTELQTQSQDTPEQTNPDMASLAQVVEELSNFGNSLIQSTRLFHWLGYGLLLLAFFDLVELLYPPKFMNPAWEFQLMGQLVERVPVPLIGFALVFFGRQKAWAGWESLLLKVLSWFTLVFAVVFFLLVPLGIFNTVRLDNASAKQIKTQLEQGQKQIQTLKDLETQVETPEQMKALLSQLANQGRAPDIQNREQVEQVKQQLSGSIDKAEADMEAQARKARSNQRQALLKSSVKWNLGALVSGALFVLLWQGTGWARGRS